MITQRRSGQWVMVGLLALLIVLPARALAEEPKLTSAAELKNVAVEHQSDATIVHITTAGAAKYHAEFMDSPNRLVVDLEDTVYAWRKAPLPVTEAPVKQIRGAQYRKGIARLVIEFTRKVGYAIREDEDGLTIVVPRVVADASATPAPAPQNSAMAVSPTESRDLPSAAPAEIKPIPVAPAPVRPAQRPASKVVAQAPVQAQGPAQPPAPAQQQSPPQTQAPAQPRPSAQTPTPAPTPAVPPPAAANNQRLISLDFKDADVINLLRILAAESGRNIVIGDDVKGKMSIALRNVPWEIALDTILSSRGLEKVEREGVMRIVSTEQLTKEREARARVEEAKLKGEAEVRAKLAEAQVKEAEAVQRKLAAEAAQREQEAKGPLREETVRMQYADPEEVAKTLQGILGIPAEGAKVAGPGFLGLPPNPDLGIGYQGAPPAGIPAPVTPVSVSQDVLNKGLTIRAHKPTNTLFLRLYEADLERVKKLIREALDIPLPQVKIEARMEILDRSALEQIGIQWGGLWAGVPGTTTVVGQGLQTTTGPGGQSIPIQPGFQQGTSNVIGLVPANGGAGFGPGVLAVPGVAPPAIPPATGGFPISFQTGLPSGANLVNLPISALPNAGPLPAAGLAFGIVGRTFNINLALQALAQQGKTRTLARPEIVTVENNKATMSLGEEIPYATISSAGTQIQFKEALLKLEVTPTVIRENEVTRIKLIVVVENNSRGDTVNLGNAGQPPAINRRKAETQVLIREGDRLIIGGVTTSTNQNTVRKVPVFGDIPLLGYLFKQKENFELGRELVVFLTPSVLKSITTAATSGAAPPEPGPAPR